jgi:hypothetical protein
VFDGQRIGMVIFLRSIEQLLNPEDERMAAVMESTEEEIYKAVLAASQRAREDSAINGGDDDVSNNSVPQITPTRKYFLQAAAIIDRYVSDIDDLVAQKMESLLSTFRRQLHLDESRAMIPTHIEDHFTSK